MQKKKKKLGNFTENTTFPIINSPRRVNNASLISSDTYRMSNTRIRRINPQRVRALLNISAKLFCFLLFWAPRRREIIRAPMLVSRTLQKRWRAAKRNTAYISTLCAHAYNRKSVFYRNDIHITATQLATEFRTPRHDVRVVVVDETRLNPFFVIVCSCKTTYGNVWSDEFLAYPSVRRFGAENDATEYWAAKHLAAKCNKKLSLRAKRLNKLDKRRKKKSRTLELKT